VSIEYLDTTASALGFLVETRRFDTVYTLLLSYKQSKTQFDTTKYTGLYARRLGNRSTVRQTRASCGRLGLLHSRGGRAQTSGRQTWSHRRHGWPTSNLAYSKRRVAAPWVLYTADTEVTDPLRRMKSANVVTLPPPAALAQQMWPCVRLDIPFRPVQGRTFADAPQV
jgi:hypothetical protein